jgi:hypothetical protein
MIGILNVVLGGALLVAGRKLFWLSVGTIGFLIGIGVAARLMHGSELTTVVVGLLLGAVFAVLAMFLQSMAIGLAGFLGGAYVLLSLASLLALSTTAATLIAFIIGGIVGVILIAAFFDWALISISAFAGASMVVRGFGLRPTVAGLLYGGLLLFGVLVQGIGLRKERTTRTA